MSDTDAQSELGWNGRYSKKMMALSWDYTAGPLRVVNVGPHNTHWARLHAPSHAVLPQPDGSLRHFVENHKHVPDAELLRQVLESGVGKVRHDRPPVIPAASSDWARRCSDVDRMRERLIAASVPLPPSQSPLGLAGKRAASEDPRSAASIFSSGSLPPIEVAIPRKGGRPVGGALGAAMGIASPNATADELRRLLQEKKAHRSAPRCEGAVEQVGDHHPVAASPMPRGDPLREAARLGASSAVPSALPRAAVARILRTSQRAATPIC